jgi:hypothetical protein
VCRRCLPMFCVSVFIRRKRRKMSVVFVTFPAQKKNHHHALVFCNALHSSSSNERDVEKTRKKTTKKRNARFSSLVVFRFFFCRCFDIDERKISKVLPRGQSSVFPFHVAKLTGKVSHVRRKRDTVRERNVTRRAETKRDINSRFRWERGSVEKQPELFRQREVIQRVRVGFTRVRVQR